MSTKRKFIFKSINKIKDGDDFKLQNMQNQNVAPLLSQNVILHQEFVPDLQQSSAAKADKNFLTEKVQHDGQKLNLLPVVEHVVQHKNINDNTFEVVIHKEIKIVSDDRLDVAQNKISELFDETKGDKSKTDDIQKTQNNEESSKASQVAKNKLHAKKPVKIQKLNNKNVLNYNNDHMTQKIKHKKQNQIPVENEKNAVLESIPKFVNAEKVGIECTLKSTTEMQTVSTIQTAQVVESNLKCTNQILNGVDTQKGCAAECNVVSHDSDPNTNKLTVSKSESSLFTPRKRIPLKKICQVPIQETLGVPKSAINNEIAKINTDLTQHNKHEISKEDKNNHEQERHIKHKKRHHHGKDHEHRKHHHHSHNHDKYNVEYKRSRSKDHEHYNRSGTYEKHNDKYDESMRRQSVEKRAPLVDQYKAKFTHTQTIFPETGSHCPQNAITLTPTSLQLSHQPQHQNYQLPPPPPPPSQPRQYVRPLPQFPQQQQPQQQQQQPQQHLPRQNLNYQQYPTNYQQHTTEHPQSNYQQQQHLNYEPQQQQQQQPQPQQQYYQLQPKFGAKHLIASKYGQDGGNWIFDVETDAQRFESDIIAKQFMDSLDHSSTSVSCTSCNQIMHIQYFSNHSLSKNHDSYFKIDDNMLQCTICNKQLNVDQWFDHEKHNNFKIICTDGYAECDQCKIVTKNIKEHYDLHFYRNNNNHHTKNKYMTTKEWLQEEHTNQIKSNSNVKENVDEDVPLLKLTCGKEVKFAKLSQISYIPTKSSIEKLLDIYAPNYTKCIKCGEILKEWSMNQEEEVYLDVTKENGHIIHNACHDQYYEKMHGSIQDNLAEVGASSSLLSSLPLEIASINMDG